MVVNGQKMFLIVNDWVLYLHVEYWFWFIFFSKGQHKCPPNGQRIRFVATHSCCHYYECINGHLKEQVCPLHKLYSVETKSCENFQVVTCGSRKKCIDPCKILLLKK